MQATRARYQNFRFLGRNQLCENYRAHDAEFDRPVVFKVFRRLVIAHPERLKRLADEAARFRTVESLYVVPLYDFQVREKYAFAVMGYCEGLPLLDCVERLDLGTRAIMTLGKQVATGLAASHASGVFVRDLRPEIIHVSRDGRARLVDIGLARYFGATGFTTTQSGYLVGTPGYVAPELYRGAPTSAASEVFALAATLYQALTGQLPYEELALEAYGRQRTPLPAPAKLDGLVEAGSLELDRIFSAALALEPTERMATALDFHRAIDSWLCKSGDDEVLADLMDCPKPLVQREEPRVATVTTTVPSAPSLRSTAPNDLMKAKESARYVDVRFQGRAHLVETYLARDSERGGQVVIKVVRKDVTRRSSRLEKLREEVTALAGVRSPYVVPILNVGGKDDMAYIVLPDIMGWPLLEAAELFRLRTREVVTLAAQLTEAVTTVHAAGVLHRDIRPECVLVNKNGQIKLVDFGLAMYVGPLGFHCTSQSGYLVESSCYTAPEIVAGKKSTPSCDVFSMGVLLYQALTKTLPYEAGALALYALGDYTLQITIPSPASIVPGVDDELGELILSAISLDTTQRIATAADFHAGLENWLERRGTGRPVGWVMARGPRPRTKVISLDDGPMTARTSLLSPGEDDEPPAEEQQEEEAPQTAVGGDPNPTTQPAPFTPWEQQGDEGKARQIAILLFLTLFLLPIAIECARQLIRGQ